MRRPLDGVIGPDLLVGVGGRQAGTGARPAQSWGRPVNRALAKR
jgi:hypothetical protein